MARRATEEGEGFGSDSFLDVITNVVGILIILVVVVGLRVQNAPASTQGTGPPIDLAPVEAEIDTTRRDVLRVTEECEIVDAQTAETDTARQMLAVAVAQLESELAVRRGQLDSEQQIRFDVERKIAAAEDQLSKLEKTIDGTRAAEPERVEVRSYPTPISRAVEGPEAFFQLRGGLVCYVPINEFLTEFKAIAPQKIYKLQDRPEYTGTLGPIEGFRMRYTLARVDMHGDGGRGTMIELVEWEIFPVSAHTGETFEEALRPDSEFRARLGRIHPGKTTVTLWAYPDSFDSFRRLKAALCESGYSVAGRPLPESVAIGGSPQGTKSAAQ